MWKASPAPRWKTGLNASLIDGGVTYDPSELVQDHSGPAQVQIYNSGVFITGESRKTVLIRRPSTFTAHLQYDISRKMNLAVRHQYVGRRYDAYYNENLGPFGALDKEALNAYHLTGLYFHYRLNVALKATIRVENLFNKRYSEIRGYATRGRGIYLMLNMDL